MAQELLAGNYIQADETPMEVQPRSVHGREREGPKRFLAILQASSGVTVTKPTIMCVALRSWMQSVGHTPGATSSQALELNPRDHGAICIVAQIDELFGINAQARD